MPECYSCWINYVALKNFKDEFWTYVSVNQGIIVHIFMACDLCQSITWINAGILLIWSLATNLNQIWIKVSQFPYQKKNLKMLSAK